MTNSAGVNWERLPAELRWSRQWCIAGPDKAPYSVHAGKLYAASVTESSQWLDFETASEVAAFYGVGIGFVLSKNDSYSCIDLDVIDGETQQAKGVPVDKNLWTTQEQLNRFWSIVQHFDTYTELSRSGKGLHIWLKGKIGRGCRRDSVEIYSQERFIICTGSAVINKPIENRQDLLNILYSEMNRAREERVEALEELDETEADVTIWQRARTADNASKFVSLCEGKWQEMGYPSQSEADLALMSMLCFYSKSNAQCRRMFRQTRLGLREKATNTDRYLNYTLVSIRSRQARENALNERTRIQAEEIVSKMREATDPVDNLVHTMQAQAIASKNPSASIPLPAPPVTQMAQLAPLPMIDGSGINWPPGFAGTIASFIYQSSPRPVKEVAIVATLGLLAGICGKTYSIPQSGLNLYIILVARSAVGKEAMHSGISLLMESMRTRCPTAMNFVDFSDFASGPALTKAVAANPSFVNVAGEWGRKLKRLAIEDRADSPMQQLRTVMTNLYQKSGPSAIVGGIVYSNRDQNIASVSGVAYSMIGETTPSTFYESLTSSMMEDGFLSRFTIVEYDGPRPKHNDAALKQPDSALADAMAQLCNQSISLLTRQTRQEVGRSEEAMAIIHQFDVECDLKINSTQDESFRQMWNRAALKVMRISALLAVADNYVHPVVEKAHVLWAIDLIRRDITVMGKKIDDGDVGINDNAREKKVISLIKEYVKYGAAESYRIPSAMQLQGIIPRKYFQIRLARHAAFSQHKLGSTLAMDVTIRSLVDSGYLMEVDKVKQLEHFNYHGKCYRVVNLDGT